MNLTNINNAARKRAAVRHLAIFALLLNSMLPGSISGVFAQAVNDRANAIEHLRKVLERPFVEMGGFNAFDCALISGDQPKRAFTCSATDQISKHYEYLLIPDPEAGFKVDMVTEPASQLDYKWIPALETFCRQYLRHFDAADWPAMVAVFHPALQDSVSVPELESTSMPIRESLGSLGEPVLESYSTRDGGRIELQYSLAAENGPAAFRCGLNADENGLKILGFLVTPEPETPLYRAGLENNAAKALSAATGQPVQRVEIPYEQLPQVYDTAEGYAVLDNGERFKIRVTRSGRLDDFIAGDYSFEILED